MKDTNKIVELLRVLGDITRLRLLSALNSGELTVSELTQVTGLSQPRVSRHLKLLCEAQVLGRTRDQNEVYYRAKVNEERRTLVQTVLRTLPQHDYQLNQDGERLYAILDQRQRRVTELLENMGIRPLSPEAQTQVDATINQMLDRYLPHNSIEKLLDIGTGTGTMLRLLAGRARRIVAVEISRDMRLVARTAVLGEGLANCTVQEGNMYALNFPKDAFDMVTMDRVLGTAKEASRALREGSRVLKPGGHLLVVETAGSIVKEAELKTWVKQAGLRPIEFCEAGKNIALVALSGHPTTHLTEATISDE
tara:strand:+ start:1071 stop:1994 length:924 start_codon:yes stop_codon:yes gene_type:complete